jgi:hypothetical protein
LLLWAFCQDITHFLGGMLIGNEQLLLSGEHRTNGKKYMLKPPNEFAPEENISVSTE